MSKPVSVRRAIYNGRHPARNRPLLGKLVIGEAGVGVRSWRQSVTIPWTEIGLIDIRPPKTQQKRNVLRDVLLFGVWAALVPRKITATVVDVATPNGSFFVMIDYARPEKVRAKLEPVIASRGGPAS